MRAITTKSVAGRNLTIRYGWVTKSETIWLDGHTEKVENEVFELEVEIHGVGAVNSPRLAPRKGGVSAIAGTIDFQGQRRPVEVHIEGNVYDAILDEQKGNRVSVPGPTHPGLCPRCHTYCHGDCQS